MDYLFSYLAKTKIDIKRLISTFLDNRRVYKFNTHPKKGPLAVVWNVNNKCNSRCMFCDYWRMNTDGDYPVKKEELSQGQRLRLISQLGDCGVGLLSFCGGEPLLSEDLSALISESKKKGMSVNISTNGFLLKEKAKMLVDSGVDSVIISMDSHNSILHDKFRGTEGAFYNVLKGIERLRSLQNKGYPFIQIRCLVNRLNAFALGEFLDFWKDKADKVIFKPIYQRESVMFITPQELILKEGDKKRFKEYFNNLLDSYKWLDNSYHRGIPDFILGQSREKRKQPCLAGVSFSEIDCEGNLYFCQEIENKDKYKLGNLNEGDFMDLWGSEKAAELRKKFRKKQVCNCWQERVLFNIYVSSIMAPLQSLKKFLNKG